MQNLFEDRYKQAAILLLGIFFIGCCIAPPYPDYLLMQHVPTVLVVAALVYLSVRFEISRLSFSLVLAFLALHTLGARYLYSYTPYDAWLERLIGFNISEAFGFQRNHYDRLVHFCYGLLMTTPIQEFERRHFGLSHALSAALAVECIMATSAAYEIIEWLVAVAYTPEDAEAFLGQQGDVFDAQKDMALATAGALFAVGISALMRTGRYRWDGSNSAPRTSV